MKIGVAGVMFILSTLGVSGCQTTGETQRLLQSFQVNTGTCGSFVQALASSSWSGVARSYGTSLCTYAGSALAAALSSSELEQAGKASERAAETQQEQTWTSADSGARGKVTPRPDTENSSCIINDHEAQTSSGEVVSDSVKMCKAGDGTWEVDV